LAGIILMVTSWSDLESHLRALYIPLSFSHKLHFPLLSAWSCHPQGSQVLTTWSEITCRGGALMEPHSRQSPLYPLFTLTNTNITIGNSDKYKSNSSHQDTL